MFFMDANMFAPIALYSSAGQEATSISPTSFTIDYNHMSSSKHEERERERRRERRRDDRDRERRRYGKDDDSDSSDYEYRRERRDRSPRRDRRRRNDSSPDSSSEKSYYESRSSHDSKDSRRVEQFDNLSPNNTIMVRGMTSVITENEIRMDIISSGMMPKDIRLIRRKDSGIPKEGERGAVSSKDIRMAQDWVCFKCATRNFKRRETCFKCNISRAESEMSGQASEEVSSHPTNTILLRNLDVLTTEEGVLEMLQGVSSLPIRAVRISRDPITNISRGVCYIELNSVIDAIHLFKYLNTNNTVDGRQVVVSYAKLNQAGISVADSVLAAAHWMSVASNSGDPASISQLAEYTASLYAKNSDEQAAYKQYYEEYYQQQQQTQGSGSQLSQNAVQQAQAMQSSQHTESSSKSSSSSSSATADSKYPTPDVSKYQYDEMSGYYYDPSTGLYYDANSQYYYNSQTGQFVYWDSTKQTYLPAPSDDSQPQPPISDYKDKDDDDKKKRDRKDDGDKVKVAKKIAKDMEKWAKELNQKKDAAKQQQNVLKAQRKTEQAARGAADAGYAVLEKKVATPAPAIANVITSAQKDDLSPNSQKGNVSSLVAPYGGGSDSEDDGTVEDPAQIEERFTDWSKMACLLCKRQFPTKEALVRHQQLSDLHKQNMAKATPGKGQSSGHYRDRAAERRKKFGNPANPQPNRLKEKYLAAREEAEATRFEQPTKHGIDSTNLGSRMMEKMGWSKGQGLGKKGQGRTDIIQTEVRAQAAGLGTKATSYTPGPGETYRDAIRKMTLNRYKELQH